MYSVTPSLYGDLSPWMLLACGRYGAMALFACLLITVLSIPLFHMLTSLASFLLRCAVLLIQRQTRAHFTWRPGSLFLLEEDGEDARGGCAGGHAPAAPTDAWPAVAKYKPPEGGEAEAVECVFCLSEIEEGEEIRELRCRHLFHRGCLDKWLVHRAAACPLCRDALLVPQETQSKCDDVDDEDEDEDEDVDSSSMILVAYVHNGWWVW